MIQPENLCSIPWTGFSNEPDGRAQPCCLYKGYIEENNKPMYVQEYSVDEILRSSFMKDLRDQFRQNKRPEGCSTCWTNEDNGYKSKRITYNTTVRRNQINWIDEPTSASELQLIINNSCNLKCRSCTPSHSTQWQNEIKILTGNTGYPMPHGQSGVEIGKLWTERHGWYRELVRLEVVGGEPFYVKQWHTIINELIDLGYSKNITLILSTNCTLFFGELLERMTTNFKSVVINLSIDGIGSTYEYLRHPGVWEEAYANMKKYYEFIGRIKIQITLTISWLNALQVPDIHQLAKTEFPRFEIWNNIVHNPEHMAIWACPESLKSEITQKWNEYNWEKEYQTPMNGILTFMNSKSIDQEQFEKNLNMLYKTDSFRKESLFDSIPYLKKSLDDEIRFI